MAAIQKPMLLPALFVLASLGISTPTPVAIGAEGFTNTPFVPGTPWHVHDPARPQPHVVTPGGNSNKNAPAPSDAVVLFDGKDFSKWIGEKGGVQWKIQDGYMETTKTGPIHTKDEFGDFQ